MSISIGKEFYGQDNLIYLGDKLVSDVYSGNELVYTTKGMEFTIDTTLVPNSSNHHNNKLNKFGLPICRDFDYNFTVYWGDGTSDSYSGDASVIKNSAVHTYNESGIYVIKISGKFPVFRTGGGINNGYRNGYVTEEYSHCIISVESISGIGLISYWQMFYNCINLTHFKAEFEYINTEYMTDTFRSCKSLVEITHRLPDNITKMQSTFRDCYSLKTIPNFPKNLKDTQYMFQNTSNLEEVPPFPESITDMGSMFYGSGIYRIPEIPSSVQYVGNLCNSCTRLCEPIKFAPNSRLLRADYIIDNCENYNCELDLRNCDLLQYTWFRNSAVTKILFSQNAPLPNSNGATSYTIEFNNLPNLTSEALNEMYATVPIFKPANGATRTLKFINCPAVNDSNRLIAIKRGWTVVPDSASIYCDYILGDDNTGTGTSLTPYKTLHRAASAVEGILPTVEDNIITIISKNPEQYDETNFDLFQAKLNSITSGSKKITITSSASNEIITTKQTYTGSQFKKAATSTDTDVIARLTNFNGDANNLYYLDISELITKYYGSSKTNSVTDLLQDLPRISYKLTCLELSSYPSSAFETIDSVITNTTNGYNSNFSFSVTADSDILSKIVTNSNELVLALYTKNKLHQYQFNNGSININGQNIEYTAGTNCAPNTNTKVSHTIFDDDEFEDYGITSNAEYKLYNVFSETNVNGKYFIDYENGKLYIYNDNFDNAAEIEIRFPGKTLKASGNLSIEDIKFDFNSKNAIEIENFESVRLSNCNFSNCNGIILKDSNLESDNSYDSSYVHTYKNVILNNNNFDNVENPIIINSDNKYCIIDFPTPRKLIDKDGNAYIEDLGPIQNKMLYSNTFNNCNKISGSPCLEIQTSDCHIYENNFNNCYGKAIEHLGVANIIENNYIDKALINTCGGAISSLGTRTSRGTKVRYNSISNISSDNINTLKSGVMLQKDTGGALVNKNKFNNVSFGVWMDGGRDNIISNNEFELCDFASIVVTPRYDNLTTDFLNSQLDRFLATDSNNNTIDYKTSKWLKYYGVGKESLNKLIGVNTLFANYAALNAYCENNMIIDNRSISCGNVTGFNDCINVDGITIINKTTFNSDARKNIIKNNMQE